MDCRFFYRLVLLVLFLHISPSLLAQDTSRQPINVVIFIQPVGKKWDMIVVFRGVVSKEKVAKRFTKLAQNAGWMIEKQDYEGQGSPNDKKSSQKAPPGLQTTATLHLYSARFTQNNAFILHPIVEAFADLKHFEISYLIPKMEQFQGLSQFDTSVLSIHLLQEGNPYRYVVTVHQPGAVIPSIPLTQIDQPQPSLSQPQSKRTQGRNLNPLVVVLLCAGISGTIVFCILLLRIKSRSRYVEKSVPHRTIR